ncbi:MAG: class I SAM-dependent methyltransferase [Bacteroidales bacterium]|nr:class I SAM-dependent methyltransferase [Bacteroidales bacterium]
MRILFYYLIYLIRARHRKGHGIHSPFVFEFISTVLYGDDTHDFTAIDNRRKELLRDRRKIMVEDYGEGSRTGIGEEREVRHIAKSTTVKPKYGRLLTRLVSWYKPYSIIELGTGPGISSAYLATGYPECCLYTIEGSKDINEIARQTMNTVNQVNVELIHGLFIDKLFPLLKEFENKKDLLVFIDGDHHGERLVEYTEMVLSGSIENLAIILDDIYWSSSMTAAWETLIHRSEIAVSIDLFQFGILFVKKGIPKQHYIVRF